MDILIEIACCVGQLMLVLVIPCIIGNAIHERKVAKNEYTEAEDIFED